jgi:hypothetical protein
VEAVLDRPVPAEVVGEPDKRAGLLEAEVVDLQPGNLAVAPAANDRLGDLVGVDADLRPGVGGPGAQLTGQVGHKHQLPGFPFGVAGEQLVDQAPGRPGNPRMQQPGRGDDQDGAGLGFAGGSWRQQQAEVTVGHRPGSRASPSALGPSWSTARLPPSSRWSQRDQGTWPHEGVDFKDPVHKARCR